MCALVETLTVLQGHVLHQSRLLLVLRRSLSRLNEAAYAAWVSLAELGLCQLTSWRCALCMFAASRALSSTIWGAGNASFLLWRLSFDLSVDLTGSCLSKLVSVVSLALLHWTASMGCLVSGCTLSWGLVAYLFVLCRFILAGIARKARRHDKVVFMRLLRISESVWSCLSCTLAWFEFFCVCRFRLLLQRVDLLDLLLHLQDRIHHGQFSRRWLFLVSNQRPLHKFKLLLQILVLFSQASTTELWWIARGWGTSNRAWNIGKVLERQSFTGLSCADFLGSRLDYRSCLCQWLSIDLWCI